MQFEAGQRDWIEAREVSRERQGTGAWEGSRQAGKEGGRDPCCWSRGIFIIVKVQVDE